MLKICAQQKTWQHLLNSTKAHQCFPPWCHWSLLCCQANATIWGARINRTGEQQPSLWDEWLTARTPTRRALPVRSTSLFFSDHFFLCDHFFLWPFFSLVKIFSLLCFSDQFSLARWTSLREKCQTERTSRRAPWPDPKGSRTCRCSGASFWTTTSLSLLMQVHIDTIHYLQTVVIN